MDIANRIRAELDRQERSIRSLQLALAEEGTPGSSYPSVHAYVDPDNDREPSLQFLRDAAEELDVRFAWLVSGEGGRTKAEEETRQQRAVQESKQVLRGTADRVEELIRTDMDEVGERLYDRLTVASRYRVLRTWQRLYDHLRSRSPSNSFLTGGLPKDPSAVERSQMKAVAQVVAGALGGVAKTASAGFEDLPWTVVTEPDALPAYQLEDYVEGVCRALTALIAWPHLSEVSEPIDLVPGERDDPDGSD